jgi:hypothetical protein
LSKRDAAAKAGVEFIVGENEDGLPETAFLASDGTQHATLDAAVKATKLQRSIERKGLYGRDNEAARLGNYATPTRTTIHASPYQTQQSRWGGPLARDQWPK